MDREPKSSRSGQAPRPARKPTAVAILGGDAVVGRALGVLLRSAGYGVVLLGEPEAYGPQELLEGADVLLLGPGLDTGRREEYMGTMAATPETAAVPVVAFSPGPEGTVAEEDRLVAWPCKTEELVRAIEAVRASAPGGEA